jgi:integrase
MRAIIAQARDRGSAFMVPAPQGNGAKPITDMAPARVLRRLGVDTSVHGLRSTFRDWPADHGVDFEVAEACLAHAVGDSTTRACFRSNLLKRRAVVMQAWAAFVTTGKTVEAVEPIRPRAVG